MTSKNRRLRQWRSIPWNDLKPGDVITYIDSDGKFCDGVLESVRGQVLILSPQTYAGGTVTGQIRVVPALRPDQKRDLKKRKRKLPAQFYSGERRTRTYQPITMKLNDED